MLKIYSNYPYLWKLVKEDHSIINSKEKYKEVIQRRNSLLQNSINRAYMMQMYWKWKTKIMNEKPYRNSKDSGILCDNEILYRLLVTEDLIIHPIIDLACQIGPGSIDIRLGTSFQSQRTTSIIEIDPLSSYEEIEMKMLKTIDEFTLDPTESYILHPGDFALACTFEYIKIPGDLLARLEGRSSWQEKVYKCMLLQV